MTGITFLAPSPFASFQTRTLNYTADINALIANVQPGLQMIDLLEAGCVPLSFNPGATPRNFIDGGDFTVNPWQRNIPGLASGGVISSAISNTPTYFADRFFAVGGASSAILMANVADTTVPGFTNSLLLTRQAANANLAAINFGQVIETADSARAQGQYMTLSFWARAAANYSGGSLSVQLIYGTGSNQSAANMVGAAWTGQGNAALTPNAANGTAGATALQPITSAMTRYSFTTSAPIPAGATQLGVLVSFTPTGTAGTTDGVYLNGFQLEIGTFASPFEHEDVQIVLEECQRYAWVIPEPASGVVVAAGSVSAANTEIFYVALPVQMYKAPAVTTSVGAFKVNSSTGGIAAATGLVGNATHTPTTVGLTSTGTGTAGQAALLQGGGGSGYVAVSSDF